MQNARSMISMQENMLQYEKKKVDQLKKVVINPGDEESK
jgi:hypothetical protein